MWSEIRNECEKRLKERVMGILKSEEEEWSVNSELSVLIVEIKFHQRFEAFLQRIYKEEWENAEETREVFRVTTNEIFETLLHYYSYSELFQQLNATNFEMSEKSKLLNYLADQIQDYVISFSREKQNREFEDAFKLNEDQNELQIFEQLISYLPSWRISADFKKRIVIRVIESIFACMSIEEIQHTIISFENIEFSSLIMEIYHVGGFDLFQRFLFRIFEDQLLQKKGDGDMIDRELTSLHQLQKRPLERKLEVLLYHACEHHDPEVALFVLNTFNITHLPKHRSISSNLNRIPIIAAATIERQHLRFPRYRKHPQYRRDLSTRSCKIVQSLLERYSASGNLDVLKIDREKSLRTVAIESRNMEVIEMLEGKYGFDVFNSKYALKSAVRSRSIDLVMRSERKLKASIIPIIDRYVNKHGDARNEVSEEDFEDDEREFQKILNYYQSIIEAINIAIQQFNNPLDELEEIKTKEEKEEESEIIKIFEYLEEKLVNEATLKPQPHYIRNALKRTFVFELTSGNLKVIQRASRLKPLIGFYNITTEPSFEPFHLSTMLKTINVDVIEAVFSVSPQLRSEFVQKAETWINNAYFRKNEFPRLISTLLEMKDPFLHKHQLTRIWASRFLNQPQNTPLTFKQSIY